MNHAEVLIGFHDTAALWSSGQATPADVVRAACSVLAAGWGGEALAMLGAVSLRTADNGDMFENLEPALAEVGLPYYEFSSEAAQEATLSVLARRVTAGRLDPRAFAAWSHRTFGHDRLSNAERLADLDDIYDSIEYTDMSVQDVDAEVHAEAKRLAALRPPFISPADASPHQPAAADRSPDGRSRSSG